MPDLNLSSMRTLAEALVADPDRGLVKWALAERLTPEVVVALLDIAEAASDHIQRSDPPHTDDVRDALAALSTSLRSSESEAL